MKPPRLPTELISAIPAAAPAPDRFSAAIDQNGPITPQIPAAPIESAAKAIGGLCANADAVSPAAPAKVQTARCFRRSARRSEDRAINTIATAAAKNGIAETMPA